MHSSEEGFDLFQNKLLLDFLPLHMEWLLIYL